MPNFGDVQAVTAQMPNTPQFMSQDPVAATINAGQADRDKKQMDAFTAMIKDPVNADAIGQAYQMPVTPEMRTLLQNPRLASMTLEAGKAAKQLNITHPETAKAFAGAFMQSNGDPMAALDAISGMPSTAPQQYSRTKPPEWYENPALPLPLQIEGQNLTKAKFVDRTAIDDFYKRATPYLEGGQQPDMPPAQNAQNEPTNYEQPRIQAPNIPSPAQYGSSAGGGAIPSPAPQVPSGGGENLVPPPPPAPAGFEGSQFRGWDARRGMAVFQTPDGKTIYVRNRQGQ